MYYQRQTALAHYAVHILSTKRKSRGCMYEMATSLTKEPFGKTSKGEEVYKFTFTNPNKVTISVLSFGCIVYEIKTPDRDGNVVDINLGLDNVADYEENSNYFGALCGRVANRIADAKFSLDGTTYQLSKNDNLGGGHFVHGGFEGFARKNWSDTIDGNKLVLHYTDPDGCEGMPGEVSTDVTYTLSNDNVFTMDYKCTTTKPTPIDLGSHFMVNLAGHAAGDIRDHVLTINADRYTESKDLLPTGVLLDVEGTTLDFRKPKALSEDTLENLDGGFGICHGYVIGERGVNKFVARVDHPNTGRYMAVHSTNSTVFAYGNFFIQDLTKGKKCKDGAIYQKYAAIELMPMGFANAVNLPSFPSPVVRPGETYHEVACYTFGVTQ